MIKCQLHKTVIIIFLFGLQVLVKWVQPLLSINFEHLICNLLLTVILGVATSHNISARLRFTLETTTIKTRKQLELSNQSEKRPVLENNN